MTSMLFISTGAGGGWLLLQGQRAFTLIGAANCHFHGFEAPGKSDQEIQEALDQVMPTGDDLEDAEKVRAVLTRMFPPNDVHPDVHEVADGDGAGT